MNVPNGLTVSRICMVPLLVAAMFDNNLNLALAIFIAGMATDCLDGHLARSRNLVTDFGKLMDPAADKLFVGSAFVCLAYLGRLEVAVVVVILAREALVSGLRIYAKRRGSVLSANGLGKAKTALQTVLVAALLIVSDPASSEVLLLVWATTLITIFSGMAYFVSFASARPPRLRRRDGNN